MDREQISDRAVARLGPRLGGWMAGAARIGYALDLAAGGGPAGCRFGGDARLEPGTPWPLFRGAPLSLLAVLDLARFPLLGAELPGDDLLVNVFHAAPTDTWLAASDAAGDPAGWRVVPAARARAVDVPAPGPAVRFRPVPVTASPVVTFPGSWEPALEDVIDGPASDHFDLERWNGYTPLVRAWEQEVRTEAPHQAFGWTEFVHRSPTDEGREQAARRDPGAAVPPAEDWRLLLRLSTDGRLRTDADRADWVWADVGDLYFVLPADDLRAGDFRRVEASIQG